MEPPHAGCCRRPRRGDGLTSRLIATFITGLTILVGAFATAPLAAAAHPASGPAKPTIVLVHGAWADASSWSLVAARLQKDGYRVLAPANPLRSLDGDAAY